MNKGLLLTTVAIIAFTLAGCTNSSAVMTGDAREPVAASEVKVYLRPPAEFDSIAFVTASSNAALSRGGSREKVVEELKEKAGALGANGIILNTNESNPGPKSATYIPGSTPGAPGFVVGGGNNITVEMQAEAVFVKGE